MPRPRRDDNTTTMTPFNELSTEGMTQELARLRAENERLADVALDALKRNGAGPADPADETPVELKKLYFVGTRVEPGENGQPDYVVPDLRFDERIGPHHTCGRGPVPSTFKGSEDDTAPHAFVPVPFGNWLIAEDGHRDRHGRMMKARFAWAGEA